MPRPAADVEDGRHAFRQVVAQELAVKVLRTGQVFQADRQVLRPETVVQVIGVQQVAAADIGDTQSDFLGARVALFIGTIHRKFLKLWGYEQLNGECKTTE